MTDHLDRLANALDKMPKSPLEKYLRERRCAAEREVDALCKKERFTFHDLFPPAPTPEPSGPRVNLVYEPRSAEQWAKAGERKFLRRKRSKKGKSNVSS